MMIDTQSQSRLEPYLHQGERLVWAGRPSGIPIVLMPLWTLLFTTFFFVLVLAGLLIFPSDASFMTVAMTIMLTIAWFLSLRYFLVPKYQIYGLTHQRALIFNQIPPRQLVSFPLKSLHRVSRSGRNRGTIRLFPQEQNPAMGLFRFFDPTMTAFRNILDAPQVEALIHSQISMLHNETTSQ